MKKSIVAIFLAATMFATAFLSGCSSERAEKAQQYKTLGIKQLESASYEEAVGSFQKALDQSLGKINAREIDLCYYKALAQFKMGDVDGAIETYTALVDYDEESRTYTCGLVYSDAMAEEYSDFVINAMEKYAAYVQASKNVGLSDVKGYFDTDSNAYADVVAAGGSRWMVRQWSGIDFENVSVGEFYVHTPEVFSCHISLTQLLHNEGREDFVDIIDMYVFLHRTEKGYKIYEWFNAA